MICQPGEPCIGTFARGATKACGTRSCTPCVNRCGKSKGESLSRAQRSSTVNRSKPAPLEVLRRASIGGKKIWGRKRPLLVDTEGTLLAVKVTGADASDHQGARRMLEPAKDLFGRITLVWEDSHQGGDGEQRAAVFHTRLPHPSQEMGHRTQLGLDYPLASACSRS